MDYKLKKLIGLFLLTTMITILFPTQGFAAPEQQPLLETTAESAILIDAVTGKVLFEKAADVERPPASVTKVMTLLVALEQLAKGKISLSDKVVTSENASGMGGSQVYLEPNEELSMREMLISIAVGSANDACVAVAEHIAGSHEAYVKMMNEKAKELGLKHTHFANAYGLPAEGHYTSARDLAVMMREALKYPLFSKLTSIKRYDLRGGEFVLWNTNKLLWWYDGCDGGKTGWTSEAKYCLASTCKRNGLRLIAVVMATPEPRSHFRESMRLYNYGFARYEAANIAEQGKKLGKIRVSKGQWDWVDAVTASDVAIVVPKGEKKSVTYKLDLVPYVKAPVKKGQKVGQVTVMKDKEQVLKVNLVAARDVEKGGVFKHIVKLVRSTITPAE
ncbi:serine-type D-Ala-D-Ala carboxypeptidase [Thermincola ferriacetica]|uniref:serine-type D-Ala-D-Ala carboxypeptidase n=2 Tax=Thermincola ferriacetica TaxID=281456 RepID=A0A0L6W5H7_9FIRM|nr:serine-type D-Ala-D-Ala carboxypeptidase [Thermincola ferriacetica]